MNDPQSAWPASYTNPVYTGACPDPFVLKYLGEYWAYCTGLEEAGQAFNVLRSRDLVHWEVAGVAMDALPGEHTCYWAPEVKYWNGKFYLYYSVGNETLMQVRVAVADHPAGPFVDSGQRLTREDFAIDAHVFEDDDGRRYLFYATDYLEHSHIGTGAAMDELLDPFTLASRPRPVTRARYDWQVYDPQRKEKGGVRWHTVEGPFVLKHKGRYYMMFSGGNWQNISYGVAYAVTDAIDTPDEWRQVVDGAAILPILRTIPNRVIGPGHNSVARGPDMQQFFCVYHQWARGGQARVLSIDRQEWVGDRLTVLGPTSTPQPAPLGPTLSGFASGWEKIGGTWQLDEREARQTQAGGAAGLRRSLPASSVIFEVWLRAVDDPTGRGVLGLSLYAASGPALTLTLQPGEGQLTVGRPTGATWTETPLALPPDFDPQVYHLVRVELDERHVRLALDETAAQWQGTLDLAPDSLALRAHNLSAAFGGFDLAVGWADLFDGERDDLDTRGWQVDEGAGRWTVQAGELVFAGHGRGRVTKGPALADYELVVNARLPEGAAGAGRYSIYPALDDAGDGPRLTVEPDGAGWRLAWTAGEQGVEAWPLPDFDPAAHQQFRFRKQAGQLQVQWEAQVLGQGAAPTGQTRVGLAADKFAAFETVRVSTIALQC